MNRTLCYLTVILLSGLVVLQPTWGQDTVEATSLLVVRGVVQQADGTPAGDGLLIEVTNSTRGLSQFDTTGATAGPSAYAVTFFSIATSGPDAVVAAAGDKVELTVRNANDQQVLGSLEATLVSADILAKTATLDVRLAEAPSPEPDPGGQLFAVRGTIYESDGVTPATNGLLVSVTNQDRGLKQVQATGSAAGQGQYVVTFLDTEQPVVGVGDTIEIVVQTQNGDVLGQSTTTVSEGDVLQFSLVIDLTLKQDTQLQPLPGYHLFVVRGTIVANGDAQSPLNGITVVIENLDRGLAQKVVSGASQVDGLYIATFVDFDNPVVDLGDTWQVQAFGSAGSTLAEKSVVITESELMASFVDIGLSVVQEPASTMVLAVRGMVFDSDGQTPAGNGLQVTVENVTKSLALSDITGAIAGDSSYAVTFVNLSKPVADVGDEIVAHVVQTDGVELGLATTLLTAADIETASLVLDVTLGFEPTEPGSHLFIVRGTVADTSGTLAPDGLEVSVTNLDRLLSQRAVTGALAGEGQYVVTFFDTSDFVAEPGDTVEAIVTDPVSEEELGRGQTQLVEDDLARDYLVLDIGTEPQEPEPTWDTNRDGIVDIGDLVVVGINFGATIEEPISPNPDINGDKIVDISDLVLVGLHFGEATIFGAPLNFAVPTAMFYQQLTLSERQQLHRTLGELERLPEQTPFIRLAAQQLRQWLGEMAPRETRLLLNYPNPFNPETWIPYELAEDVQVQLSIYDVHGQVIRELSLGYQQAGSYTTQGAAAYWDGRNSTGQRVGSGVYFYQMRAGDFTATRKMVIMK